MEEDFMKFIKEYSDKKFKQLIETKEGKMTFDVSTSEEACKSATMLEQEIINVNINLLYAYHQWLKNNEKI